MKGLKRAVIINFIILLALALITFAFELNNSWDALLFFFLSIAAAAVLAVLLFVMLVLCAMDCNCIDIIKPLNRMFMTKLIQAGVYLILSFYYVGWHIKSELEFFGYISDDYIINAFFLHFSLIYVCFCAVGLCSSLFFLFDFFEARMRNPKAFLLWLTTIFPIIDLAVIAALRRQPKEREKSGATL